MQDEARLQDILCQHGLSQEFEIATMLLVIAESFRDPEFAGKPIRIDGITSHRIVHIDDDQQFATCMTSDGKAYRISLESAAPDLSDRGTQEQILVLIRENLDVTEVWDHYDRGTWRVLATRAHDRDTVELATESDRAKCVVLAFLRIPGNSPPGGSLRSRVQRCSEHTTIVELILEDQPQRPYCFLIYGDDSLPVPLGPGQLETMAKSLSSSNQ